MELTSEQMLKINKLSINFTLAMLDYCLNEKLGIMTVSECLEYTKLPKATVYKDIKDSKLKTITILSTIGIIMND